jgi:hypothetical protein
MGDLEIRRMEILSILGDIEYHHGYFTARGIDASDPGDREAYDIISRIERRLMALPVAKQTEPT